MPGSDLTRKPRPTDPEDRRSDARRFGSNYYLAFRRLASRSLPLPAMPYQLTAAQLELQAARKAAKLAKAEASKLAPAAGTQQTLSPEEIEKRRFLRRAWISTPSSSSAGSRRAKIITWNVRCRRSPSCITDGLTVAPSADACS